MIPVKPEPHKINVVSGASFPASVFCPAHLRQRPQLFTDRLNEWLRFAVLCQIFRRYLYIDFSIPFLPGVCFLPVFGVFVLIPVYDFMRHARPAQVYADPVYCLCQIVRAFCFAYENAVFLYHMIHPENLPISF